MTTSGIAAVLAKQSSRPIELTPKLPDLSILGLHGFGQRLHARQEMADDLIHSLGVVA